MLNKVPLYTIVGLWVPHLLHHRPRPLRETEHREFDCTYPTLRWVSVGCKEALGHQLGSGKAQSETWENRSCFEVPACDYEAGAMGFSGSWTSWCCWESLKGREQSGASRAGSSPRTGRDGGSLAGPMMIVLGLTDGRLGGSWG